MVNFRYNLEGIIKRAFRITGKYAFNDSLLPEDYKIGVELINSILIDWSNDGIRPQVIKKTYYNVFEDNNFVSVINPLLNVLECYLINEDETQERLDILDYVQYMSLGQITEVGKPKAIAYTSDKIYLIPNPDVEYKILVVYVTYPKEVYISDEDELYISQHFYEAMVYEMALRLADELMLPVNDKLIFEKRASYYKNRAFANKTMNEACITLKPTTGVIK